MKSLKAAFVRDGAADNERGSQLYVEGDYQGAYEAFKRAIEKNPANAVFYVNRSAANLQLSKLSEAYRDACRALELNNKLARGYVRKGQVLLKKGEPLLAKRTFHEGMKHAKNASDLELLEQGLADCRTAAHFLSMAGVNMSQEDEQPLPSSQSAPTVVSAGLTLDQVDQQPVGASQPPSGPALGGGMLTTGMEGQSYEAVAQTSQDSQAASHIPEKPVQKVPPVEPSVHWSVRMLENLPKPSSLSSPKAPAAKAGAEHQKKGIEAMYSPGFLQKHSLNFSSMRDNWLAVVPDWVKGEGEASLFKPLSEAEDALEAEILKRRASAAEGEDSNAPTVQFGRCIHPIDADTKELVKLDGFFAYEYDNNRLFEHLNTLLMSQEQDLVEAIFSMETERKTLLKSSLNARDMESNDSRGTVQIAFMLPQDVTLDAGCKTYRTVLAHMGLLSQVGVDKWTFESFCGGVKGVIDGTAFTVVDCPPNSERTEESIEHVVVDSNIDSASDIELRGEGEAEAEEEVDSKRERPEADCDEVSLNNTSKQLQVLRKRTFRMPGLQEPLLILLVSEPLWEEPFRMVVLPPHGGLVAEGDLPGNLVERFWFKLKHPAASKLSSDLARFTARFCKNPPASVGGKRERILDFLGDFSVSVQNCPLWQGCREDELVCAREAVNKRVMSDTYHLVFPSMCDASLDSNTANLLRSLWFLIPEQLNVNREDLDESILYSAKKELLAIDMFRSPREKVECILNCCRIIIFQLDSKGQISSADDFLPLLILVVLHGGSSPRLHTNLTYINAFCERTEELAEAFYYLTMLESAVYFIDHITAKQIRMPQFLFDKYMRGEMPLYRPMTEDRMLSGDNDVRDQSTTAQRRSNDDPTLSTRDQPLPTKVVENPSSSELEHSVPDSLLQEIEEEQLNGDSTVELSFITNEETMSVEGLQLEYLKADDELARLVSEYCQLARLASDLMPSAIRVRHR